MQAIDKGDVIVFDYKMDDGTVIRAKTIVKTFVYGFDKHIMESQLMIIGLDLDKLRLFKYMCKNITNLDVINIHDYEGYE